MSDSISADADIIKIDMQTFKKCKDVLKDINSNPVLLKKKQDIYNNNNCFHITYPDYNTAHGVHGSAQHISHKTNKVFTNNQNRLYIITSDFTEDGKIKKQIIGYLNKLTESNKESLYQKIKDVIDNVRDPKLLHALYESIWEFIKKSADQLYINILKYFDIHMTTEYIHNYVQNKDWYPPEYAFENNVICANTYNDQSTYDMYCNYVKWKNSITNYNKVIVIMLKDKVPIDVTRIEDLLHDLYKLFETCEQKDIQHLMHFALEQMQLLLFSNKNNRTYNDIIHKLRGVNLEKFDSLSRFLILDILEL
jgi:hypothetical protein